MNELQRPIHSDQLWAGLRRVLDDDIVRQVWRIEAAYNMLNDSVDFTVVRRRDGASAVFEVARLAIFSDKPRDLVKAFRNEPEQLARLILFLS